MSRKILLLNVCLLALLASLGWWLRGRWLDARSKESAVLSKAARRTELLPPPSPPLPASASAAEYPEVVTKTLFSKDRDPNVAPPVPPPPPPPKPEDPVPPRPVYHGQMGFGPEPVAFLSIDNKAQKGYYAGDDVGPFKLVAFDRDQMKFEWHGKTLEYKLSDLKPSKDAVAQQQAAVAPPPPPPTPAKPVTAADSNPALGEQSGQLRTCTVGDTSPPGTVLDGYKKVIAANMMGQTCFWEPLR